MIAEVAVITQSTQKLQLWILLGAELSNAFKMLHLSGLSATPFALCSRRSNHNCSLRDNSESCDEPTCIQ